VLDGAVAVHDGRVVLCGPRRDVLFAAGGETRDLGQVVLFPGLVNAHTHLELSWMGDDPPLGGDYTAWVRALLARRAARPRHEVVLAAAETAARRMAARGTVAVGDIGNEGWTAGVFAAAELHALCFLEIYGFRAAEAAERLAAAERLLEQRTLRHLLTPHAPHTTSAPLVRAVADRARSRAEPLSIHVAESEAETDLLRDGSGPFAALLQERGMWDDAWRAPGCTPVAQLDRLGALTPRTLAVHCVQLETADIELLRSAGSFVVSCPRSNRRLGVGVAAIERLLAAGIRVALGTDSLASAGDLDLFAEMAAMREAHPGVPASAVVRMATLDGAAALGLDDRLGSIEPGKLARLNVVPLDHAGADPHEALCSVPRQVFALSDAPWEPLR
jgi:cytosine/adenosine deaminase-related metal-dependent hydrolase